LAVSVGNEQKEKSMSDCRIIQLRASNFYGGPERQLHFHARLAQNSDFRITVCSFTENREIPGFVKVIEKDNIPTHTFSVQSAYDFSAVSNLKKYLKDNDIQILCTHDYRTHMIGCLATLGTKTKWIAFSRGWTSENLKIKAFCTLDKVIIRFADRIVAVSEEQKRKLVSLLIPAKKIAVAHNAIDPNFFSRVEKTDLRAKFNLPQDSIICLAGGRFSAEKGQKVLVKAASIALTKNPRLRFLLFGDGPDLPVIRNLINNLGLENKAICPGFEKDLLSCLRGSDILVNPSLSEGLPNIVLEAMAFKIPVVATAVGGVPELIEDGLNGFLAPPKNSINLTEKILKLAEDETLRHKFAQAGYDTIIQKFSFDRQSEKLYSVYRSVLKND